MAKRASASAATGAAPSLDAKSLPSRPRGKNTYEVVLATAGEVLAEVGFERLTTNLVCERAGLTPPALYRYFPNKYALISELARRLMEAQDEAVFQWLDEGGAGDGSLNEAVAQNLRLQKRLIEITRGQPGGLWLLRAIRAVPAFQEVRTTSRNTVLERMFEYLRRAYPNVSDDHLRTAMRLTEQMTYAAVEMIIEDPSLDDDKVAEEVSWMVSLYYHQLPTRGSGPTPSAAR
ncbi:TetR family transcriptional regulator [Phenylobacterium sp. Root77]|jgi:AcrR family transcriptional regulator|uniref:TetR/AcrR family transcriptional regulator n=1 Tax=unclassified Phenylobacterium TaxID=2640670 RepID=UPI0006F76458|nr:MULTISPECIES: TetR/AcrR family transcriptional regulator [unclassified Phenylobacterium]KQW71745.1 TetR family transcriptional regulator [Phenylobacterium sp. Root1277]KQW94665.1 TetR family transcriptional regulator [Phenylobacterium sp. Root1290]KRC44358.1 TetR family transcriptional regulator [Phenylobacterium sp. Root77]